MTLTQASPKNQKTAYSLPHLPAPSESKRRWRLSCALSRLRSAPTTSSNIVATAAGCKSWFLLEAATAAVSRTVASAPATHVAPTARDVRVRSRTKAAFFDDDAVVADHVRVGGNGCLVSGWGSEIDKCAVLGFVVSTLVH